MKLKRILTALTLALVISMTTISAQPGGGGMGGPGGGMGGPGGGMGGPMQSSAIIDPVAMTGYFEMDVEKAIKKIKVKDEVEKSAIRDIFANFAVASADVYINHPTEFQNLEAMKEMMEASQMDENFRSNMREMMSGVGVVKKEMLELHKVLQADMQEVLSSNEKSSKRWELYYKDICDTNNFSEREPRQRGQGGQEGQGRPEGGMGREGGMGMGGPGGF